MFILFLFNFFPFRKKGWGGGGVRKYVAQSMQLDLCIESLDDSGAYEWCKYDAHVFRNF